MNNYTLGEPSSRASRETFLVHLYEYLVQSGCMQTANALTKEVSFGLSAEVQDTFFYDWWCSLLSLHNFAGQQQQDVPRLPGTSWGEAPMNLANIQRTNTAEVEQQTFKRPNQVRSGSVQSATSTSRKASQHQHQTQQSQSQSQSQQTTPLHKKQQKPKGKARKGSPILVPGVAPLVVARNASRAPTPTSASDGRHSSVSQQIQRQSSSTPQWDKSTSTPQWDNNQLATDAFQREYPPQRVPPRNLSHQPQMVENRGVMPPNNGHIQIPSQVLHASQKGRQSGGKPMNPQQQYLQHQQLLQQQLQQQQLQQQQLQQQQQFLQSQQQGQVSVGGQAAMVIDQNALMGTNSMPATRGGTPFNMMAAPGLMADGVMGEVVGNSNDASFLDYMMGSNPMANGGLNFSAEATMDGMAFEPAHPRPENEFGGNGELYIKNEYGQSRDSDFDAKMVNHAGMTNHAPLSAGNFGNANFGLAMNSSMPPVMEDYPMFNDANSKMGPNFVLGAENGINGINGINGDFFLEAPMTMTL